MRSQTLVSAAIALHGLPLFQIRFDFLKRLDAFALHVTLARSRQDWLGHKTVLDAKPFLDGFLQELAFGRRHAANVANLLPNRKPKAVWVVVQFGVGTARCAVRAAFSGATRAFDCRGLQRFRR